MNRELRAHAIVVQGCLMAICATKKIAQDLATSHGYKGFQIREATRIDFAYI